MSLKFCLSGAGLLALTMLLSGCNPYPLPGPLVYGRCGMDAHTESYPYAKRERDAYGCKSDDAGYLEGPSQGDKMRN
jgi:hypothetical protein